ncbi:OmpL47-type beta-barrel domain-containing protein [Paraburkholderia sp. J11-2]|uniref:OmpL47-type beta-barrel domain-containing protein n=1 Tax=Paraburkholderia sp. J11-2 TaxID=2805431 RepID=UPI002AB71314|nr:hypothetical protein [Paraburkholderia sp. J11-2]
MAARSVSVNLKNASDVALIYNHGSLSHGIITTNPPSRIEPGTTGSWESESSGVATGTEGEVFYDIETAPGQTAGTAHFHWDNPFVGSNSYDESVPDGYKAGRSGGDGDNATVNWTFDCSSSTCDGIPDDWKLHGVTIDPGDGSGPQFIDLPAMGATVNKPDIFIQLDWMADSTHSHAISAAAIKSVVDAFANAPYKSRTGSVGINLHIDAGPNSIMNFATSQTWGALSRAKQLTEVTSLGTGGVNNYDWTAFDKIKNAPGGFTSTGRTAIFHYVISAHQISTLTNSGVARTIPGSDFIISLTSCCTTAPTDLQQAGTLMHELGHNLGLHHGGGDDVNNKPNYVSLMNYLFQFTGLTRNGVAGILDYSNVALDTLDETNLDETSGVGAAAKGVQTSHWVTPPGKAGTFVTVADASQPIDWNGNGISTDKNVTFDINGDGTLSSALTPYDDWKNLRLKGGAIGAGGAFKPPMATTVDEITPEDMQRILPPDTTPPSTQADVSPPPNAAGWNRTDVTVTFAATDDISGVARTEYLLDGGPSIAASGPLLISNEGIHDLQYHSVDYSQNVEVPNDLTVKIDKTPPEAVIFYDPQAHRIIVTGRDALSGVAPGAITPISVAPAVWTNYGSDTAQIRSYIISDIAGNTTALTVKVRCQPDEFELSVVELRYGHQEEVRKLERNTIEFRRLRGCGASHPLLAVTQRVSLGDGQSRSTVSCFYDVLYNESHLSHTQGSNECSACLEEGRKSGEGRVPVQEREPSERIELVTAQEPIRGSKPADAQAPVQGHSDGMDQDCGKPSHCQCPGTCGFILLHIATDKGRLDVEKS